MTSAHVVFSLACLLLGKMVHLSLLTSSPSLHLKSSFISSSVGGKVTLRCSYEGDESAWISWYMQTLGQTPKLICSFFVYSEENTFFNEFKNDSRFSLIRENQTTNQLIISDLKISDSAIYYCACNYAQIVSFGEGATVIIRDSSPNIQALVYQSDSETIEPGNSVTLNCTVQIRICDGEHSVYWFRNSEESYPGLIYSHGGKNDLCERNPSIQTHTCVYNLPLENLKFADAGTYYCAVNSCGHMTFGNGTTLQFTSEGNFLLHFVTGSVTGLFLVLVLFIVYRLNQRYTSQATEPRYPHPTHSTPTEQGTFQATDSLDYASVDVYQFNRSRIKKSSN